jgi:hypothetical protein
MNSMRLRLPCYEYSLTLALSLLEGEGINPEHADPLFGKIHLRLHLNSSVSFQISRLSASSSPSPFQGEGKGEGTSCGPDTGRVNENVLPLPSSDSTQILPPCNSTRALEIARPRPVPFEFAPFTSAPW